jgi:hypothetical protein
MPVIINGTTGIDTVQDGIVTDSKLTLTANSQEIKDALNASGSAPIYACRAWVNFNGTGTVAIRASGNVSSITDNGTGAYTVNMTTALTDTNYSIVVGAGSPQTRDGSAFSPTNPPTTTTFSIRCWGSNDPDTSIDHAHVFAAVFR